MAVGDNDDSDYDTVVMRTKGYITNLLILRSLNYLLETITEAINTPVRAPRTPIIIHRETWQRQAFLHEQG